MRPGKVRLGDLLSGLAGVALLALLFAPWFRAAGDESAWHSLSVTLAFLVLAALLGLAILGLTLFERTPALPVAASVFAVPFTILAAIVVAVRLIWPPDSGSVRWGAWGGLACTLLILAGAWSSLRSDVRP